MWSPPHGVTTCRTGQRGWVQCELGGGWRQWPWWSDPQLQKLALGMCVRLRGPRSLKLDSPRHTAWALERVSLRRAGLSSILEFPPSESFWAGVSILMYITPVDERVASLRLWVGGRVITIVYAYMSNSSLEYPPDCSLKLIYFCSPISKHCETRITGVWFFFL